MRPEFLKRLTLSVERSIALLEKCGGKGGTPGPCPGDKKPGGGTKPAGKKPASKLPSEKPAAKPKKPPKAKPEADPYEWLTKPEGSPTAETGGGKKPKNKLPKKKPVEAGPYDWLTAPEPEAPKQDSELDYSSMAPAPQAKPKPKNDLPKKKPAKA